jgi:hypothetical protein
MAITGYGKQSYNAAAAGQLDSATRDNAIDSMACSATGPIPFGRKLERDTVLGTVKVFDGIGVVYGISLRQDSKMMSIAQDASYTQGDSVPCLRRGRVWLYTGNSASAALVIGDVVAGIPSSEVIGLAVDNNGDKLALIDVNIPVA